MRSERIEASRHKRGRVLVFLEGGALLKVTEQELLDFGLRKGDELDEETLERLKKASGVSDTKATAADLIGRKAMSRRDLERKLREKGANEAEARYAAEWLEAIGAIDDAAYAATLVRHCASRGYGPAESQIEAYLASKLRGRMIDEKEKKRLVDGLLRRGYPWSDVKRVMSRMLETYFED